MKPNSEYIYQNNFSKKNDSVLNSNIRIQKSKKIFAVLKNYLGKETKNLKKMVCLDIGGSAGFTAKLMSPFIKKFYVVDIDKNALKFGKKNNYADNIVYKQGDAMNLHFKKNSIDIIVCNMVYEHVPDSRHMMSEIFRILKTNGVCYFGAANKYSLLEPHYKLPFLSWFPKRISNIYLKIMKKGSVYYENLLSYYELKKLFHNFFVTDYTADVINNPEKFYATDMIKKDSLFSKIPRSLLRFIEPIIPDFILILKKENLSIQPTNIIRNKFRINMSKQSITKLRIGTYFRSELFKKLKIKTSSSDKVLDVGCFDGYWLSTQTAQKKYGLDIDIKKKYKNIKYIQASALDIPLNDNTFDKVFAFDVIEHVPINTEKKFLSELIRVIKNKGNVYLTFPSDKIKIFPSFLTKYVSRKWGHFKYLGLSQKMIEDFLADFKNIKYKIITLNTRYYLAFYLLLRILWLLNPKITKVFLKYIIKKDFKNLKGKNGYFLVIIKKNESSI